MKQNFNTTTLDEIIAHQRQSHSLAENSVAITLDDGFADNFEYGFAILQKYNIPATIFLTAGLLGHKNLWMSSRGFPERKLLTWDKIKLMQGLVKFGAHTVNHVRLTEIDQETARKEISESKAIIEENLGVKVKHFAYPYGLFDEHVVKSVKESGFESACTTRSGFNNKNIDVFRLRRIEIFGDDTLWKVKQKLKFGTNDASVSLPLKYYASRIVSRVSEKRKR